MANDQNRKYVTMGFITGADTDSAKQKMDNYTGAAVQIEAYGPSGGNAQYSVRITLNPDSGSEAYMEIASGTLTPSPPTTPATVAAVVVMPAYVDRFWVRVGSNSLAGSGAGVRVLGLLSGLLEN